MQGEKRNIYFFLIDESIREIKAVDQTVFFSNLDCTPPPLYLLKVIKHLEYETAHERGVKTGTVNILNKSLEWVFVLNLNTSSFLHHYYNECQ